MQRYLWQQAEGLRHAYDTTIAGNHPIRGGHEFTALCGQTVTPQAGDLVEGAWLDPECETCLRQLVVASNWSEGEIERLFAIRAAVEAEQQGKRQEMVS